MKVGIVTGHFMPEIGYQEVLLARAYSRLGHEVKVFTSTGISPTGENLVKTGYKEGEFIDDHYGYSVIRIRPMLQVRSKVVVSGLRKKIFEFQPDVLIILAVAKVFPYTLLKRRFPCPMIISIFGDAWEYKDRTSTLKRISTIFFESSFGALRKYLYNKAVENCDRVVLNIPETEQIFTEVLNKNMSESFAKKKLNLFLGFDPDEFFFSLEEREEIRNELGISKKDFILIITTRVNRTKKIERIIEVVDQLHQKKIPIHCVIIGFLGDQYEEELQNKINLLSSIKSFHCFPFLDHSRVRKFYAASDAGLWLKAAISIQESMGTGLPVFLQNMPSVNHLIKDSNTGWYFEEDEMGEILEKKIRSLLSEDDVSRLQGRLELAAKNKERLSYDKIANSIIAR